MYCKTAISGAGGFDSHANQFPNQRDPTAAFANHEVLYLLSVLV